MGRKRRGTEEEMDREGEERQNKGKDEKMVYKQPNKLKTGEQKRGKSGVCQRYNDNKNTNGTKMKKME